MVLMDVTLNVILGNVSCGANVTSLMCIDEPTSPWHQFTINPTSPPAGPTSPRPMPTSPSVNLTLNPTSPPTRPTSPSVKFTIIPASPPTRPTSPSRLEERLRCVVRGKSRGDVSDQTFASASRDAVRRRHGDARLCRRVDELGSITGLRFSLGLRPPVTPLRWPGSQRPGEQGSILAPTPLRMDPEPVSSLLWPRPRGQPTSASWNPEHSGPHCTTESRAEHDCNPSGWAGGACRNRVQHLRVRFASAAPWRTRRGATARWRPPRQNLTRIGSGGCHRWSVTRPAPRRASSPPGRRF